MTPGLCQPGAADTTINVCPPKSVIYLLFPVFQNNMSPFSIEDHTADVRLKVSGRDKPELFGEALRGMTEILTPQEAQDRTGEEVTFSLTAPDAESLLVDFLNEALFVMQTRKSATTGVKFSVLNATQAEGRFFVKPVNGFAEDVKAATYHDVHIRRRRDGSLQTVIVFDI